MTSFPKRINTAFASLSVLTTMLLFTSCDLWEKPGVTAATPEAEAAVEAKDDDSRVIISLVAMHQEEIALSQVALQKSNHKDVTDLARMLEAAHTRTLAELTKLAEDQSLAIPTELNEKAAASKMELNKLSGKEFDLAYCEMMVEGHGRAIARMEGASSNAKDSNLRGWATRTLPHLRQHLEEALACQKKCQAV